MQVAVVEEGEVFAVVFEGDEVFEVLMCKMFEGELDVVRVKEQLSHVLEFEDMRYFEPFQEQENKGRDGLLTDLAGAYVVKVFERHIGGLGRGWWHR